ncbi:MAG: toll/interleukin-1 receptor domain-containing protein [Ginsengibacter sp.]
MIKYISEPRDWDELLKYIFKKNLTPVIGKEMFKFKNEDSLTPIDDYLSKQLLEEFDVTDQPAMTLPEALNYLTNVRREEPLDIKTRLNSMVEDIADKDFPLLSDFLSVNKLSYYINTTVYNNVLEDKLKKIRKQDANTVKSINFSINRPFNDIGILEDLSDPFVFNVFGSLLDTVDPALTEEDMLEYVGEFKEKLNVKPNIINALKNKNLLFLGCAFPDWMVRFILRLLSSEPLHDWGTKRRIYIINDDTDLRKRQFDFLENYRVVTFKGNTNDFVKELSERWPKYYEEETKKLEEEAKKENPIDPKLIFLSYTRSDQAAVETLKGSLEKIENVTCWYDKENIEGGDKWNSEIQFNIRKANLFIPLISANSLTHKGAVQDEWRSAVNEEGVRNLTGQHDPYLIPIVIDDSNLYDPNLPDFFKEIDIKQVRDGNPDDKFINTIKARLKLI